MMPSAAIYHSVQAALVLRYSFEEQRLRFLVAGMAGLARRERSQEETQENKESHAFGQSDRPHFRVQAAVHGSLKPRVQPEGIIERRQCSFHIAFLKKELPHENRSAGRRGIEFE
jgi:hypothetical protein